MSVFIFGLGFSSRAAVRAMRAHSGADLAVAGTTRSSEKSAALTLEGVQTHVFDGTEPGQTLKSALATASHVVISTPPGPDGDPVLNRHGADLMSSGTLEWLCYYSTVGVYGDYGGAWIDETAAPQPVNERSRRRVAAEQAWRDFAASKGVPLVILRLAGIYGSGRSTLDKLAAGTSRRIVKPGQVFNRIHAADIGEATARAARQKLAGTFNLADDEPAPPQDPIGFAAGLMGIEPPPEEDFESAEMSAMARSFYSDNKRVSNAAIKRSLDFELFYPTYRQGLRAIFDGTSRWPYSNPAPRRKS